MFQDLSQFSKGYNAKFNWNNTIINRLEIETGQYFLFSPHANELAYRKGLCSLLMTDAFFQIYITSYFKQFHELCLFPQLYSASCQVERGVLLQKNKTFKKYIYI